MDFKIPKQFKLFAQTIKVEYKETLTDSTSPGLVGMAEYKKNLITLQLPCKAIEISTEQLEQIFLHEMVHFILSSGGLQERIPKEELENFTETFSNLLHQALKTAEHDEIRA